jgi:DHA1 family bicyclomycin/chloramphenicol resistance-like MFS transporter
VNVARATLEARLGTRQFIALISMLMALTALAIDMMLPAFGAMRDGFALTADSNALAPVVTVFLLGLGVGQPVWGPLSDALGRKRILWIGIAIYVVGALGSAFAPSLAVLLLWRFLGGIGAGAIRVVTHGVVRDAYAGEAMAKILSYIMAVFILVPVIAPSVGALVLSVASWRWVFGFFVVFAVVIGAWATRLPETLPPERRQPLRARTLGAAARAVLTSRFAMGLVAAQMLVFAFFASYLASSELIIRDVFGLQAWFPVIFGGSALVLGAGMLLNPRLIDRLGLRRWLRLVLSGYLVAVVLFAVAMLATGGEPPFWLFMASLLPVLLAHSFVIPNLNAAAMMPMGNIAGTAAAVVGSIVTLGGAALGAIIDRLYNGTVLPFALAGVSMCALGYASYRWADAVWGDAAERELMPLDEPGEAVAMLASDIS